MADVSWSTEPVTNRPVATISTDRYFQGYLGNVTGVYAVQGSNPIRITFMEGGIEDLAFPEIVRILGNAGCLERLNDSRTYAQWP